MIGVRWLGHATTVIDVAGVRLVTDPLLRHHVGALRRVGPTPDPSWWAGTDAALVSHLHLDHADRPSLRRLGVPVLGGPAVAVWARRQRLTGVALSEDWTPIVGAVQVRLVRADHHSRPWPGRSREAYGFLVRAGEEVVWFAGDTALYPEMAVLASASISLALLPIHGWGPRLSAGHMDAEQAAEAALLSGARRVVPVHWGTFHAFGMNVGPLEWMSRPIGHFEAAMDQRGIADRALVLRVGERAEMA
ncbi:MAG TPA: MBL fold metallo-hydrolase [Lapillicoccus sp.]|nr:MBL fold metallo-hydrolase [Lapillicoccus sp.]